MGARTARAAVVVLAAAISAQSAAASEKTTVAMTASCTGVTLAYSKGSPTIFETISVSKGPTVERALTPEEAQHSEIALVIPPGKHSVALRAHWTEAGKEHHLSAHSALDCPLVEQLKVELCVALKRNPGGECVGAGREWVLYERETVIYEVYVKNEGNTAVTINMPTDALGDTFEGEAPATLQPGQRHPSFAAARELQEGAGQIENQAFVSATPLIKHATAFVGSSNTVRTNMRK